MKISRRRVVVTGLGIVSSIGNNKSEVTQSLRAGRSGIEFCQEYADLGFRSKIHGPIHLDLAEIIDRKLKRFMGDGAAFNYIAMREAIDDCCLSDYFTGDCPRYFVADLARVPTLDAPVG